MTPHPECAAGRHRTFRVQGETYCERRGCGLALKAAGVEPACDGAVEGMSASSPPAPAPAVAP